MLLFVIIRLRRIPLLVRVLASDKYLTGGLLLKLFLIDSLWTNQQADIVDPLHMRKVDLASMLEHFRVRQHIWLVE